VSKRIFTTDNFLSAGQARAYCRKFFCPIHEMLIVFAKRSETDRQSSHERNQVYQRKKDFNDFLVKVASDKKSYRNCLSKDFVCWFRRFGNISRDPRKSYAEISFLYFTFVVAAISSKFIDDLVLKREFFYI